MQMNEQDWANAQRAETLRLSGAYEQAIEIFEKLQEKYPDNAWVNAHLGATYYQLMNYGKAKEYLEKAIAQNKQYLWAHAHLGETYRLWAIANYREQKYIDLAIEHFNTALDSEPSENSNYAWALAHLGATYRLKMTRNINLLSTNQINEQSKEEALNCLNRALELIPTYAWAWGMRATVYRLAQEYEDSYRDLEVETVIAPEIEVLQHSPSPIPFLQSRRINLHEHALLCFYLTKREEDPEKKAKHYSRAIAYALQALTVQPGDLIAKLILITVKANQQKEKSDSLSEELKKEVKQLLEDEDATPVFFEPCKTVLRYLVKDGRNGIVTVEKLKEIKNDAGEEHKLTQLVLKDVVENPDLGVGKTPQLWLWKNFALTETCGNVLFLLSDLSKILKEEPPIGKSKPYRALAAIISPYFTVERLYQTPVLSSDERAEIFNYLFNDFLNNIVD